MKQDGKYYNCITSAISAYVSNQGIPQKLVAQASEQQPQVPHTWVMSSSQASGAGSAKPAIAAVQPFSLQSGMVQLLPGSKLVLRNQEGKEVLLAGSATKIQRLPNATLTHVKVPIGSGKGPPFAGVATATVTSTVTKAPVSRITMATTPVTLAAITPSNLSPCMGNITVSISPSKVKDGQSPKRNGAMKEESRKQQLYDKQLRLIKATEVLSKGVSVAKASTDVSLANALKGPAPDNAVKVLQMPGPAADTMGKDTRKQTPDGSLSVFPYTHRFTVTSSPKAVTTCYLAAESLGKDSGLPKEENPLYGLQTMVDIKPEITHAATETTAAQQGAVSSISTSTQIAEVESDTVSQVSGLNLPDASKGSELSEAESCVEDASLVMDFVTRKYLDEEAGNEGQSLFPGSETKATSIHREETQQQQCSYQWHHYRVPAESLPPFQSLAEATLKMRKRRPKSNSNRRKRSRSQMSVEYD